MGEVSKRQSLREGKWGGRKRGGMEAKGWIDIAERKGGGIQGRRGREGGREGKRYGGWE